MVLLYIGTVFVRAGQTADNHYCPYFKNRAPSPQTNLENCTWYKENSCCMNHELNSIFTTVSTPLRNASEACRLHINYLMCFICAPNQETFYQRERLTVCEEFCDRWYNSCKDALLKGFTVKGLYSDGTEFCRARKFLVASGMNKNTGCYTFPLNNNRRSSATAVKNTAWVIALLTLLGTVCGCA